jgi:hypothetical protein
MDRRLDSSRAEEHSGDMLRAWGRLLIALLMVCVHLEDPA